jgi:hypothetical protein
MYNPALTKRAQNAHWVNGTGQYDGALHCNLLAAACCVWHQVWHVLWPHPQDVDFRPGHIDSSRDCLVPRVAGLQQ